MRKAGLLIILFLFFTIALGAQEVSEKQDITIFRLSFYDWDIPNSALGSIDSEIKGVFVELGRFNVIGSQYRLKAQDIQSFIQTIREFKEENVEIPEEVNMGYVVFSEKDLNNLIGSFIVVIPAVTYFNVMPVTDDYGYVVAYETEIKTSFSFLDVNSMVTIAERTVETSGYSENRDESIQNAIESIPSQLQYEIRSIEAFTLKTGVLDVYRGGVTLELGRNMGIKKGYEFVILEEQVLSSGHVREVETGLVLVNNVSHEVSEATILYGTPIEGMQLKEVPRFGIEGSLYFHGIYNGDVLENICIGVRGVASEGFYAIRPVVGVEIPLDVNSANNDLADDLVTAILWAYGVPFNAYVGAEYSIYMGRLQVSPTLVVGAAGIYPYDENDKIDYITHVGGKAMLTLSYLFSRDAKAILDVGYAYWFETGKIVDSYGGALFGGGVTFKL